MPPRLYVDAVDAALAEGSALALPPAAARHAQVLRLQPGDEVALFDGRGGEWSARIEAMAKRDVRVCVLAHNAIERELPIAVTLALAMPAGDRMDFVVEKATELGAAAIQPLVSERSVLRLAGERAEKRQAHWQSIAIAACEQCGRNRVPSILPVLPLTTWLGGLAPAAAEEARVLLGWRDATPWPLAVARIGATLMLLSGPEGGFADAEEDSARLRGFVTAQLGPRVLRADTAPLACLAAIAMRST
jgi:16S rRNA (uracil1498-N3)-methyltransferase